VELLTPLNPDERALLLREAEAACAAKKHFGGTQSLFWLRHLCKCANRQEEIAFHNRRHREFQKLIGTKVYRDPVAAVDAQGSRLRRELEDFPLDSGRVVTLAPGEWGLAWKTDPAPVKPQSSAPWEMLARATGKIYFVIPSTGYFPVVNQLLVMKLAPRAEPRFCDGEESPLLESADALVAVGTPVNNAAIAELSITGNDLEVVALQDACGALVIPCSNPREGLALLRRAIRGPHREGGARTKVAV
jgi:hypothetical protein